MFRHIVSNTVYQALPIVWAGRWGELKGFIDTVIFGIFDWVIYSKCILAKFILHFLLPPNALVGTQNMKGFKIEIKKMFFFLGQS